MVLWRYRRFIWEAALDDLRHRYAGTSVGVFWNILVPASSVALYLFVFGSLIGDRYAATTALPGPFALYLIAGILPWLAFADAVQRSAGALVANADYLKKLPVPEEVFVAQVVVTSALIMLLSLGMMMVTAMLLGIGPHVGWLVAVIVAGLWQTSAYGLGLALAGLSVFLRDLGPAIGVLLPLWMWSLPVVYMESLLPAWYQQVLPWTPAYPFLQSIRDAVLLGSAPDAITWLTMLVWAVGLCAVGSVILARLRPELRDSL